MSNEKTIYFHIGVPKTGTTSLQTWLTKNEQALSDCDVRYMKSFRRGPSHNYLTRLAVGRDKDAFLHRKISYEIESCPENNILISSETAYGEVKTPLILNILPEHLLPHCKVFFYFRRQDLFLEAMVKQKFKGADAAVNSESLYRFIQGKRNRASYLSHVRAIMEKVPQISISCKPFDRSILAEGNITADFWDFLSLPRDKRPELPQPGGNMTPSVELLRALGETEFPSPAMRRATINRLIATEPELFRSKDILSNAHRAALMETFREENRELSAFCGFDLEELFYDKVDYTSESRVIEDPDAAQAMYQRALKAVAEAYRHVMEANA